MLIMKDRLWTKGLQQNIVPFLKETPLGGVRSKMWWHNQTRKQNLEL